MAWMGESRWVRFSRGGTVTRTIDRRIDRWLTQLRSIVHENGHQKRFEMLNVILAFEDKDWQRIGSKDQNGWRELTAHMLPHMRAGVIDHGKPD